MSLGSIMKKLMNPYRRIRALERELAKREQQDLELKTLLSSIEQNEAFLEQSARIARLGYAIWDDTLDRDITVSDELARIHGLERDEYLQVVGSMQSYINFIVPDDRKKYQEYEDLFTEDESGDAAGCEYRIMRADGEIRHLHQRSKYIPVRFGRPTQSIVVIQDVTEQKEAEIRLKKSQSALKESEDMLTESAAMADLGHAIWDNVGDKYVSVSEGWVGIHGYTKEEFLAMFTDTKTDEKLIHPADRDRYREWNCGYTSTEKIPDIEYRIVRRDGKIRHLHEHHKFILDKSGEPTKSLLTIQDISKRVDHENELNEARNAAEQASLAKSSFLALMSHEIRTPLNAVLGALGLIDSEDLDPAVRNFLNVGRKGAESLLHIVNDILDFSKIEAGKLRLEPALFNVQKTIDDVLQVLEPRAQERNISLTSDLEPNVPEVLVGDAGRVRQILLNLCSNAVRFTTEGGVHVSLSPAGQQDGIIRVRFQVEDTGCGVHPKDHEHLFEEFWGTNTSTLGSAGNTGIGLSICKQLVEAMGGSIGFDSEFGRGSLFWFELPLEAVDEEMVAAEKDHPDQLRQIIPYEDLPMLQGRVLLAEDNSANQLIEQTVLERIGLQVDVVANGYEAIAAVRSVPYDIVLMDINMPEMDGIEATAAIRKFPGALSSIPIIAMTALAMPGDREKFLSQGMNDYVSKPIIREELYACIASFLKNPELLPAVTSRSTDIKLTDKDSPVIDTEILGDLIVKVGAELLPQVIDVYLSEASAQVDAISAAARSGNCELVAKEAHSLKSSSAGLAAMAMAELASQLEQAGVELDLKKIVQEVVHLPSVFERTREELLRLPPS